MITPDSVALLVVLLTGFEVLLLATWAYERRVRRRMAMHHCGPGCSCRGVTEGRAPR